MLLFKDRTGDLFPDWIPFEPVRRTLTDIGLSEEEVSSLEAPFDGFRHQGPDDPLPLPEGLRTSDDWFRLLFVPTDGEVYFDSLTGRTEYGRPSAGFSHQINLDNIGRDFLCLLYLRQRVLDLWENGGLEEVLSNLFRQEAGTPNEFNSLTNSLLRSEALTDVLFLRGYDMTDPDEGRGGEGRYSFDLLTDPPSRRMTLTEVPSAVSLLRDTTNLSRLIRQLSVCLQDGGKWEDLNRISSKDFRLPYVFSPLSDRRLVRGTDSFARETALSREFCLWDPDRGNGLPSIRTISERKGIPYLDLLRTMTRGYQGDGRHRFDGLMFSTRGLSARLVKKLSSDIRERKPIDI